MKLFEVFDKLIRKAGDFIAFPPRFAYRDKSKQAWCDGFKIGSAPWQCYCCQTVQAKVAGIKIWDDNPTDYRNVRCTVIVDQFGHKWQWPAVKWVYLPPQVFRR